MKRENKQRQREEKNGDMYSVHLSLPAGYCTGLLVSQAHSTTFNQTATHTICLLSFLSYIVLTNKNLTKRSQILYK